MNNLLFEQSQELLPTPDSTYSQKLWGYFNFTFQALVALKSIVFYYIILIIVY